MRLEVSLEPFPGLKIDLNALYEDNRRTEFQFMFEEMPVVHGGSFAMTTISLSSAFETREQVKLLLKYIREVSEKQGGYRIKSKGPI